ncbi:MAG: NTP transferase domain-containing protein [Deltaproteobacteria bacterium]|nr:NTP transferase domain-containing protein [Deltaproteobacteria bacterium]
MKPLSIIVLAAGNSTRLKSQLTKVLHPICGRPLIDYVLETARSVRPRKISVVLGNDREKVQAHLQAQKGAAKDLSFAHQKERRGTAQATQVGLKALGKISGHVLILSGDVPLLRPETLKRLLRLGAARPLSLVTAVLAAPFGYGRIMRDLEGRVCGIVEEKNASPEEKQINEINAGIYCVEAAFLKKALAQVRPDPVKKEYYLTDIIAYAVKQGLPVHTIAVDDAYEILGVQLLGNTQVGRSCHIGPGSILINARLGEGVQVKAYSHLEDCTVKSGAVIGPFARLRPASIVEEEAHVGNFVELKKTRLGKGSKANHLSYLGDAVIGRGVNIGAGTITCNYDGKNKFQTYLEDGVFVGSDTQLVAPVKVGKGAYIGAGTTVTMDVPAGSLAISRVPQRNIPGYKK